jgi:hypothetical protein
MSVESGRSPARPVDPSQDVAMTARRRAMPSEETAAEYDAAWQVDAPVGDVWTPRPWVHPSARAT